MTKHLEHPITGSRPVLFGRQCRWIGHVL